MRGTLVESYTPLNRIITKIKRKPSMHEASKAVVAFILKVGDDKILKSLELAY